MSNIVLFGSQWGDEGKGKIIDVLTQDADWVVRYQGGNNAGHTVEIENEKFVLHLTPSGILRKSCKCIIGNGLVVDLIGLCEELEELENRNIPLKNRLYISDRAHIVLPYHKALDGAKENLRSENKIGTTKRGIGPAYCDKADRTGLRMCDILENDFLEETRKKLIAKNDELQNLNQNPLDIEVLLKDIEKCAEKLKPFIIDTVPLLNNAMKNNDQILFEGAQGIMLDVDFGTYPYVTSSNTGAGGVSSGAGVPPQSIDRVIGIVKAYTTRVGGGPFPTELTDETGKHIAEVGAEFGATTGRPRRCGWFDAVVAKYACMIGGIGEWALMKLDVLDDLDTIRVCTAYEIDGNKVEQMPSSLQKFKKCIPIYEDIPGWKTPTTNCTSWDELPDQAKDYIKYLEEITLTPISIVSVGPKRASTIIRN